MHIRKLIYRHTDFADLRAQVSRHLSDPSSSMVREWNRFESNICAHFKDRDAHWRLWQYEQALLNQALAIRESSCPILEQKLRSSPIPDGYLDSTGIVATFHSGSYRALGKWLVLSGHRVKLLVSARVKQQQHALFGREISSSLSRDGDFGVLDAEEPMVTFKIRRALAEGYMVLIYLDGNVGRRDRHTVSVPLMQGHISLRMGATDLARIFKVPIYPIYSKRTRGSIEFVLHDPLRDLRDPQQATEALFSNFADILCDQPFLWENWFFLDEFKR